MEKIIFGERCRDFGYLSINSCSNLIEIDLSRVELVVFGHDAEVYNNPRLKTVAFKSIAKMLVRTFAGCPSLAHLTFAEKATSCDLYFGESPVITEQSCLNIINAIADNAKIKVQLHSTVKTQMTNTWYCKLSDGKYVSCTAEDEGAVTQAAAILARGGTLT